MPVPTKISATERATREPIDLVFFFCLLALLSGFHKQITYLGSMNKLDMADSVSKNLVYEPFLGMDHKENDKYVRVEKKEMCASKIVFTF